jgi:hypothetical protein
VQERVGIEELALVSDLGGVDLREVGGGEYPSHFLPVEVQRWQ